MTLLSNLPQSGSFDTGPLSWVMNEIRESLRRSRALVDDARNQDPEGQATSLRQARAFLHQADGALQIVDLDGVSMLTGAIEKMLDVVLSGQQAFSAAVADAHGQACSAVTEYLEELLLGAAHQPVRLYPYYRAVLAAAGNDKAHPSDLFFPNLAIRPQLPVSPSAAQAVDFVSVRQRFERMLLPFLRSTEAAAGRQAAAEMASVLGEVERAQSTPDARRFWWVLRAFAEGVANGEIRNDLAVRQLFGRINLQFRRLAEGSQGAVDRLLRDALFFIAAASSTSGRTAQVKSAWQLEGQVPADYETPRYGRLDQAVLARARECLNQAKNLWTRLANGDESVGPQFEKEMQSLADAGSSLGAESLAKLLRELNGIARAAHTQPGEAVALEMAGSLLFVENALNHASRLTENFAAQADMLTARLLSVVAGEQPAVPTEWLDDMSRDAQQKETVSVLAGEMRTSLNQVEKGLEEFYADSDKRDALPAIDAILHQIEGALAVLEQDEAAQAIAHTRSTISRYRKMPGGEAAPAAESQRVARNLGALSFFLETLQKQTFAARERFMWDPETGCFQARLLDKAGQAAIDVVVDPLPELAEPGSASQAEAVAAAASVPAAASVDSVAANANLAGTKAAPVSAAPMSVETPIAAAEPADGTSPAVPAQQAAVASITTDEQDAAVDAELLEIFLGEAEEVLEAVAVTLPMLEAQPASTDHLTTIRRSFHTLKGSGRMVGLHAFGEAAWSIEQALNLRLADAAPADVALLALLRGAHDLLSQWVAQLRTGGTSSFTPDALVAAAARVRDGHAFSLELAAEEAGDMPAEPPVPVGVATPVTAVTADAPAGFEDRPDPVPEEENILLSLPDLPLEPQSVDEEITLSALPDDDISETVASISLPSDAVVVGEGGDVESGSVALPDLASLSFELESHPDPIQPESIPGDAPTDHAEIFGTATTGDGKEPALSLDFDLDLPGLEDGAQDGNESTSGQDASMVPDLQIADAEDAPAPEERQLEPSPVAPPSPAGTDGITSGSAKVIDLAAVRPLERAADDDNVKRIGTLEISLPLYNIYLAETDDLVRLLAHDFAEWRHESERPVHTSSVHAAHSLAGTSATVGLIAVHEIAHALEMILQSLARRPVQLLGSDFLLMQETVERIRAMLARFARGELPESDPALVEALEGRLADIALRPALVVESHDELHAAPLAADMGGGADEARQPSAEAQARGAALLQTDELDPDLLPVFLEEGGDLLPLVGRELRAWQASPAEAAHRAALLRMLHTIKGSARMAGAMSFGQHVHEMETLVERVAGSTPAARDAIEDLLNRHDLAVFMFERLQNPSPATSAPPALPLATTGTSPAPLLPAAAAAGATVAAGPLADTASGGGVPLVRVRADVLDRLVNQAGEVSIARSRAETEVEGLRQSLVDLTENVSRLRSQLREIEIQAESQMASQMVASPEREFDPLEFDRFTRLQELTRMMAESVNDVASLQGSLARTLDNTDAALTNQARLTRELQKDLMRVRMVQFASISERLYRLTRQVAKEVDKRVNLEVRGGAVEIDRGVLEKMAGPFEHLLRNAIVHGLESRAERAESGKPEIGEIQVEVRQEGNEVVIQFSDDGRGLDLQRIRSKAQAAGLIAPDVELPEGALSDLIFHPGFTTATEVTALAGRGVGMDVVRSEAAALGGRVEVRTEAGRGAQFLVRLPLTLAVTQVVLLSAGGKTYAVPSVLVEQVQQLKSAALASAYNAACVNWLDNRVGLHYLSALLGDLQAVPVTQQYSPVVILRSGGERIALHVDEVLGNREVVVKNIGPQLSRLAGIAGATVLGTGDIVLILNPIPLAQRLAAAAVQRAPLPAHPAHHHELGAVAEMATPPVAGTEPVQGLRSQPIVMVVDDSLTVRRVTQRLLAREGYQVVLAKDGVDALQQLQTLTPDVMLLDIEMPRMDGFDLTRNIRGDERTRGIPIVMITSRTAEKHRNYAMELGVNAYLGKPYQEPELLALVKSYANRETVVG